jgi:RHS repeat-associated protein
LQIAAGDNVTFPVFGKASITTRRCGSRDDAWIWRGNWENTNSGGNGTPNDMNSTGNRWKKMQYNYDLISGKVNEVAYQAGFKDAFYHRYSYDAENRLTYVETSSDRLVWERDARYQYYKHGPLARTVIGQNQVQGIDYAYTLQGWLKGVNSTSVNDGTFDMGIDGMLSGTNSNIGRDVFGFSLNYFSGDYKSISSTVANPFVANTFSLTNSNSTTVANGLFNGNIASMFVNIPKIGEAQLYGYKYDQLNRIKSMDAFNGFNNTNNSWSSSPQPVDAYLERVVYDPNGNITTYKRNGNSARITMDDMTYSYKPGTNQLDKVVDVATDASSTDYDKYNDIKQGQANNNYVYDKIGNLVQDKSEFLHDPNNPTQPMIEWTVYGKISKITKIKSGVTTIISYGYDASGNRISKNVDGKITYYVRDASGNVMSVYEKGNTQLNNGDLTLSETHLYGSSRLGIFNRNINVQPGVIISAGISNFERGNKFFELSNHLGNVLVTVSDKRIPHSTSGTTIDWYSADVVTANDYYPFGMNMPGRSYTSGSLSYRYGFNGKELDNEVVQYDYGFRIYDPRLGRFKSVDPLFQFYPWFSPYQFAGNSPILNIDLDGLENMPTQPNTQPQNPDERFKELYEKFKEVKPYLKDATKLAKVSWQFQAGVYAAKIITEGKILNIKSKIGNNSKEIDKLTQEIESETNNHKSNFRGFASPPGEGGVGGGGATGTWTEDPKKPRVKTAAEIKREQTQKKIEALKKANESLEWEKQKYETVREGLNEFTMFGDVQDEVLDIIKVVQDPTPENIKKYIEDKGTQYVKSRLLDGKTKEKTKEKNKSSSKKSNNGNTP